ncbi:hypothetical protein E2F46_04375 [Luteimonas aestuarii]|uniref:Uncharacterized protein n=1 Tax=Luteimonas aestuarii TaxID=453837 RepID=A0A4R5U1H7_9GAMM|nr:hypothetical protein [Luteimonas aestuarii]TDK27431.1 hypothetical protein E2F46_04375 [Luteimonas aestuarii]
MHDLNRSPLKQLEQAPLLDPPDTLWPRLRDRQRGAVARRRMLAGASAVAATGMLAVAALLPWSTAPHFESHPPLATENDVVEQIATLDRALQAAYESDASDPEIEPMWVARAQLMHGLSIQRTN